MAYLREEGSFVKLSRPVPAINDIRILPCIPKPSGSYYYKECGGGAHHPSYLFFDFTFALKVRGRMPLTSGSHKQLDIKKIFHCKDLSSNKLLV
jgi:hypothetical protein